MAVALETISSNDSFWSVAPGRAKAKSAKVKRSRVTTQRDACGVPLGLRFVFKRLRRTPQVYWVSWTQAVGLLDYEQRDGDGVANPFDGFAVDEIAELAVAVGGHDDEIDLELPGGADDFVGGTIGVIDQ